jgi:hypothetical protein
MLSGMDARQHDDVIFTISQAILDARYAPPKRRRWRGAKATMKTWSKPPAPYYSTPKDP